MLVKKNHLLIERDVMRQWILWRNDMLVKKNHHLIESYLIEDLILGKQDQNRGRRKKYLEMRDQGLMTIDHCLTNVERGGRGVARGGQGQELAGRKLDLWEKKDRGPGRKQCVG